MIVFDIEASSPDNGRGGIWQIGAIELESGEEFLEEARIDEDDEVSEEALRVIGKTEEELRDESKQTQKELIENFINWTIKFEERMLGGHNVGWDMTFLSNKCMRYGINEVFRKKLSYRALDIQTIAQVEYKKQNGKFLMNDNGRNDMNLTAVLEMCGVEDPRHYIVNGEVKKEGVPHDALLDAKLTAVCFEKFLGEKQNE